MEGSEENRAALLMGLDMLTSISYVDEVRGGPGLRVRVGGGALRGGFTVVKSRCCLHTRTHTHTHARTHHARTHAPPKVEVFKTCLDYWALFVADIYSGASIPTTPGGGNHVRGAGAGGGACGGGDGGTHTGEAAVAAWPAVQNTSDG